jgi:hypothetical protein
MIYKYMLSANRPYSPINVFDNLHGSIPKPALLRLMDKLVADGKLTMKLFNKSQVYWVAQSAFEDVSEEAMAALAEEEARVGGEAERLLAGGRAPTKLSAVGRAPPLAARGI